MSNTLIQKCNFNKKKMYLKIIYQNKYLKTKICTILLNLFHKYSAIF